jgi:peptidoglycan/LPS O-acetylase OafA/YrhL
MATVVEASEPKVTGHRTSYIAGIDALRALAVTSVIIYHLQAGWLPGGFIGVDIFFAISGYLITKTLLERPQASALRYFTGFYIRRFKRIAPALLVYVAVMAACTAYFVPRSYLGQGILTTAKWAVFGASNIQLVMSSDGYFGDRVPFNPFLHTWSLGVEEQFYLIYPIILLLVGIGLQRSSRLLVGIGQFLLAASAFGSLAFCVWQTKADPLRAFYLLPSRYWELAAGALLYLLVSRVRENRLNNPAFNTGFFCIGLGLIGTSLVWATMANFPFWWAVPAVMGALALIHVAQNVPDRPSSATRERLTSRPIIFIGKISYSLYLWHWGIFVLMRWTIGLESLWTKVLSIVLTLLLGWLSYTYVESLPRRSNSLKVRMGLALLSVLLVGGLASFKTVPSVTAWAVNFHEKQIVPVFRDDQAIAKNLEGIPESSVGRGHKVLFVGDSHAGHYRFLAEWTATKTGAESTIFEQHGCGFANLKQLAAKTCPGDQKTIDKIKHNTQAGDIVVLSSLSVPRISEPSGPLDKKTVLAEVQSKQAQRDRADALANAIGIVQTLKASGLTVVLAAPSPVYEAPPERCQRWFNRQNPVCARGFKTDRAYQLQLRAPVMKSYQILSKQTGAVLWDPFSFLCPANPCQAEVNGRFLFSDGDHLTANGNLVVFDNFLKLVDALWNPTQ